MTPVELRRIITESSAAMGMALRAQQSTEEDADKLIADAFKKTAKFYADLLSDMTGKTWKVSTVSQDIFSLDGPGPKDKIDIYWEHDIETGAEDPRTAQFTVTVEGPLGVRPRIFRKQTPADIVKNGRHKSMELLWWLADALKEWAEELLGSIVESLGKESPMNSIQEHKGSPYIASSLRDLIYERKATPKARIQESAKKEIAAKLQGEARIDLAVNLLNLISEDQQNVVVEDEGKVHAALVSIVSNAEGLAKTTQGFSAFAKDALKGKTINIPKLSQYGMQVDKYYKDLRDAFVAMVQGVHEDVGIFERAEAFDDSSQVGSRSSMPPVSRKFEPAPKGPDIPQAKNHLSLDNKSFEAYRPLYAKIRPDVPYPLAKRPEYDEYKKSWLEYLGREAARLALNGGSLYIYDPALNLKNKDYKEPFDNSAKKNGASFDYKQDGRGWWLTIKGGKNVREDADDLKDFYVMEGDKIVCYSPQLNEGADERFISLDDKSFADWIAKSAPPEYGATTKRSARSEIWTKAWLLEMGMEAGRLALNRNIKKTGGKIYILDPELLLKGKYRDEFNKGVEKITGYPFEYEQIKSQRTGKPGWRVGAFNVESAEVSSELAGMAKEKMGTEEMILTLKDQRLRNTKLFDKALSMAFKMLGSALGKTKLPTQSGEMRRADPNEFMYMQTIGGELRYQPGGKTSFDPSNAIMMFKHSDTRNYVYLRADGRFEVPKENKPFFMGYFDVL